MTPRSHETEMDDQVHWAALLAVQVLNAVALVALILAWPVLAVADWLRRPGPVTIMVAPAPLSVGVAPCRHEISQAA